MGESMTDCLSGTQISIREIVEGIGGKETDFNSYAVIPIGVGKGFVSQVFLINFEWNGEKCELPKKVVVKVPHGELLAEFLPNDPPPKSDNEEKNAPISGNELAAMVPLFHLNECIMYDRFRKQPPAFPVPKIFKAQRFSADNRVGYLIQEDLSDVGGQIDINLGLSMEQLLNVAEFVAKLQAYSLTYTDLNLDIVYPELCFDKALAVSTEMNGRLGLPEVISHGDLHANNIFFRQKNQSDPNGTTVGDEVAFVIDWQITHFGSIIEDFGRLIISSSTTEFRRTETETILRHYYDTLNSLLPDEKPLFPFEAVVKAYDCMFLSSAVNLLFAMLGVLESPAIQLIPGEEERKIAIKGIMQRTQDTLEDMVRLVEEGRHRLPQ